MGGRAFDRKAFWEDKILAWERGRYELEGGEPGLLQRVADRSSDSLRFRLAFTARLLAPYVADAHVVDLGCGTGLLAEPLLLAGARRYTGIDLAESAVAAAQARAEAGGWADQADLRVGSTSELEPMQADLVISLGLTDWLDDAELDHLFALGGRAHVLHAYSERRATPGQWLHRAYCWASYGHRSGGYVPRYFDTRELGARLQRQRPGEVRAVHHPRLSFGALLTTLPVGVPVEAT